MANKRETDYEKLGKCLAEKNLSSEHFADLRGIEHAEYLKTITTYLLTLQEVQEKSYENNDLMREVEEYITLNEKIAGEMMIYEKRSVELEAEIANFECKIIDLTKNYIKKMKELTGKFDVLDDDYHLHHIKTELMNVQCKKEDVTNQLYANQKILKQLKNRLELIYKDVPNFNGVFDEKIEKEKIKKYGDLAKNKKRLADIRNSYNELAKKIENLNQ